MTLTRLHFLPDGHPEILALEDSHGVLVVRLLKQVASIPFICGKPVCDHHGCREVREAQDTAREILAEPPTTTKGA